jgi:hypothetical protein
MEVLIQSFFSGCGFGSHSKMINERKRDLLNSIQQKNITRKAELMIDNLFGYESIKWDGN